MSRVVVDARKLKALQKRLARLGTMRVKVGVIGAKAAQERDGVNMATLAAIHEFGSPASNIPERSFIRSTFRDQTVKARKTKMGMQISSAVINGLSPHKGLALLGTWGVSEIKNKITEGAGIAPSLSPVTVAIKKSSRPLVDTGRLINAITYAVDKNV